MLFFSGLIFLLTACPNPQRYPIEPQISFKQIVLTDTIDLLGNPVKNYKLIFHLIDGDGDIGFLESDTVGFFAEDSVYKYNIFTEKYEIVNGDTLLINDTLFYRTKFIQPIGQNKTLIADIQIDYDFTYKGDVLSHDSVFFVFKIVDRMQHWSNEDKSPLMNIDTVGYFPILED